MSILAHTINSLCVSDTKTYNSVRQNTQLLRRRILLHDFWVFEQMSNVIEIAGIICHGGLSNSVKTFESVLCSAVPHIHNELGFHCEYGALVSSFCYRTIR